MENNSNGIRVYTHHAQYYETDKMGIIHHSNYIRWMEEARVDMLDRLGVSYGKLEESGIMVPVLSVSCQYKRMVHFDDTVAVYMEVTKYNGIKLEVSYKIIDTATGELCTTGLSTHCFLNSEGRPVSLKNANPEFHRVFSECLKNYIDLHVHSNASDGTLTPTQVVEYAKEKNLYAIALTDHDTVDGIEEAVRAAGEDIKVIPGIEISADYEGTDLHILGLNIDYKNRGFLDKIDECRRLRKERNIKMIARMNELGFPVTKEIMEERYGEGASITRAHFARYMLDEGFVGSKDEAFEKYLDKGALCYISRVQMKPETAVSIILKAGGHPVLAHPFLYKFDKEKLVKVISYLKGFGLQGIEAVYSLHTPEDESFLKETADKLGLYITGGSDFHGSNKPDIDLGTGRGNLAVEKRLLNNIYNNERNVD